MQPTVVEQLAQAASSHHQHASIRLTLKRVSHLEIQPGAVLSHQPLGSWSRFLIWCKGQPLHWKVQPIPTSTVTLEYGVVAGVLSTPVVS